MVALLVSCVVTTGSECGDGTHEEKGACVPDAEDTATDSAVEGDADADADSDADGDADPDYTVCGDGSAPFTDIQDAVDAAADGDVIYVCAGTYNRVEIERRDVSLAGDGSATTTIDGGSLLALSIVESSVSLTGLALTVEPTAAATRPSPRRST